MFDKARRYSSFRAVGVESWCFLHRDRLCNQNWASMPGVLLIARNNQSSLSVAKLVLSTSRQSESAIAFASDSISNDRDLSSLLAHSQSTSAISRNRVECSSPLPRKSSIRRS